MYILYILLGTCLGIQGQSAQKSVLVSLNAKWQSTSLIAEASEYVATEGNDEFWKFVNNVNEKTTTMDWTSLTSEQKYRLAEQQTAATLGKATDLLDLSLSIRTYSPRVQLFQQIGSEYSSSCLAFFDVHGTISCSADELEKAVEKAASSSPATLLSVDHIFPSANTSTTTILVYGDIGSPELAVLHKKASSLARQHGLQYALRHYQKEAKGSMSLSGYGVELAIKNTEYKAVDDSNKKSDESHEDEENLHGFNFKILKQMHKQSTESLDALRMHLKDIEELVPLKQWQVQDLGFQAAQWIVQKENEDGTGIAQLKDLSQNFPLHARDIARIQVEKPLRAEIDNNVQNSFEKLGLEAGESALYVNGINMEIEQLDMFDLVDTLKQEEQLSTGFHNMGINREYLSILTGLDLSDEKVSYALDYRDAYPFYLNNLDTDKRYKQWGNSVKLMLQPYYPGMIRPIARNLFNLIFVVNPADPESRNLMKIGNSFYQHEIPLRIGYIFAVNPDKEVSGKEDVGVAILNLFNFLSTDTSIAEAMQTVIKLVDAHRGGITAADVKTWFIKNHPDADYEDVFGPNTDYDKGRSVGAEFLARTAIGRAPKVLLNGYALEDAGIKGDKFEETVMMEIMKVTPKIQRAIMNGQLTDRNNVGNWLLDQKEVMPRLNARVLDAPLAKKYIDYSETAPCKAKTLAQFLPLSSGEKSQCLLEKSVYLTRSEDQSTMGSTLWVVADVDTVEGRQLAYNAIKQLKHSKASRIALLLNPADMDTACSATSISSLVHASLRLLPRQQAKQFVTKLVKEEFAEKLIKGQVTIEELAVGGMNLEHFNKEKKLLSCDKIKMEARYSTEVLGVKPGQAVVIANGLVIGPLEKGELLEESDFGLIEKMLINRGAGLIVERVDKWEIEKENGKSSDLVLRIASLVGRHAAAKKRSWVVLTGDEHSAVTLVADHDKPAMDIVAIVDPLSPAAQKLAPVLEILRESVNCDIKIVMNPKPKLSELPLKRFYRYVATAKPQFLQGELIANSASFTGLPSKQLLTMSLHAPDAWMVENIYAEYDLDNIKMSQVSSDVIALFSLEHILMEGQCFDEVSGNPPRGLQFVLGTPSDPTKYDTIVMANLGYFQLKANPGAWQLRLREGRSKDIYKLTGTVNTESHKDGVVSALIDSFSGRTLRVRVAKQEGKEEEDLLSDKDGGWGLNLFSGEKTPETINVFSLASGHLYERFMRIMFLSVIKNTKSPVKFWLLKNYLSPQFKESLPILAKEYGFEYALVEYKWPRWLNNQKEKQRVMWGYKILFLDVLFPLDVQKMIFVDADQIVRADLMELMQFDLEGAPYGYVPFCESRKEMDGFRFWKQGYWMNHLAGRKYHISALYVIDLQKFRQVAAGDRLRGQYQGLSADPNSLANLDQDLPNNMIHQVKIKSLPQEWLWCETWCDDASKKSAKTIDLCNNPLTKEPKLDSASRIVTEWNDYDQEIKQVLTRSGDSKETKKHSHTDL